MTSRPLLAVLVVATVALAGCGGGPTAETTPQATTQTTTPGTTQATTGGPTETLRPVDADAEAVKADVLAALDGVETYHLNATIRRTQAANGVTRNATVESAGAFDRAARELRVQQDTTSAGQSTSVTTYLVNGTLYQQSPSYVQAYSSQWVKLPLPNVSQQWQTLDTVARQRAVLGNSSVSVAGGKTVDGTDAHVLDLDVDEDAYDRVLEGRLGRTGSNVSVDVSEVQFRYVVAAESGRLLTSTGTVDSTVTAQGQTVALSERVALRFSDYGDPVSVTLPEAADTAVDLSNRTAG